MTTKANFTEDEWTKLVRAPMVAGLGVSLADPGGPIELGREAFASIKAATDPTDGEGLVVELSQGLKVILDDRHNPISDLDPRAGVEPAEMILNELREANRIIGEKASPEEARGYRTWVLESAQKTAEAAKEGGFFGIGAVQISEGEESMLSQLEDLLGETSG